jgi:hypothetical protein
MALQKAKIVNVSVDPVKTVEVLFNPTEYGIDEGASYAELPAPGLKTPILQFVRGEASMLNLELFLDGTTKRLPVDGDLDTLRAFVRIDKDLHAPPVCRFEWGKVAFQGVVTSFREKYQLFAEDGGLLRVRVTMSIKSYVAAEVQLREMQRSSPDRTRVRVVREGETIAQLAEEAYGNPGLWRVIAEANDIDRPRFLSVGRALRLPAI